MKLEEVAKRAKVSTATVSRVLNNVSVVKTSTRSRVMKAVEELKYHPNLHARTLAGGKSRTIGVIVSNMENPFFFDIYKTVESDAHAAGYEVVVANTDYRIEQLVNLLAQLANEPEFLATNQLQITGNADKTKVLQVRLGLSGVVAKKIALERRGGPGF